VEPGESLDQSLFFHDFPKEGGFSAESVDIRAIRGSSPSLQFPSLASLPLFKSSGGVE
jgi:hypothetical protein